MKTYVLDTNVLIQAPHALQSFEENQVVLPIVVLEELDHHKTDEGEPGANARQVIRFLEQLRGTGNLLQGVALPSGGTLRVETNHIEMELPPGFRESAADNRILRTIKGLAEQADSHSHVVLVTKDIMLRIKAQIMGLAAEDYTTDQVKKLADQYLGRRDLSCSEDVLANLAAGGPGIDPADLREYLPSGETQPVQLVINEFVILHAEQNWKQTMLGRFDGRRVVTLSSLERRPFGVTPRNVGQRFLQEALLAPVEEAPLVIVKGAAGTAKTFYSLAAGLEQTFEPAQKRYRKIMIVRPNTQFAEDIGFLPGTEEEKIAPLMRPIIDNLEILVDRNDELRYHDEKALHGKIALLFDTGTITTEAMNYMRGRSISGTYLIVDEAQNLTPKQAKGLLTRAGTGTKLILIGDPEQIDNPLLDERTNGLSYASEKMRGSRFCWQLTLTSDECERSDLAQDAAERMA